MMWEVVRLAFSWVAMAGALFTLLGLLEPMRPETLTFFVLILFATSLARGTR